MPVNNQQVLLSYGVFNACKDTAKDAEEFEPEEVLANENGSNVLMISDEEPEDMASFDQSFKYSTADQLERQYSGSASCGAELQQPSEKSCVKVPDSDHVSLNKSRTSSLVEMGETTTKVVVSRSAT